MKYHVTHNKSFGSKNNINFVKYRKDYSLRKPLKKSKRKKYQIIDDYSNKAFIVLVIISTSYSIIQLFINPDIATSLILINLSSISLVLIYEKLRVSKRLDRFDLFKIDRALDLNKLERNEISDNLEYYFEYYDLLQWFRDSWGSSYSDVPFVWITKHLLMTQQQLLASISQGKISLPENQTPIVQNLLFHRYKQRFDAVSRADLDFWLLKKPMAIQYFEAGTLWLRTNKSTNITRIFILDLRDLEEDRIDVVTKVLVQHEAAGLGWAIAIEEEFPRELNLDQHSRLLDFGLFDGGEAVTFFRQAQDPHVFDVLFNTPRNTRVIENQKRIYSKLIGECWLCNAVFRSNFVSDKSKLCLKNIPDIDNTNWIHNRVTSRQEGLAKAIKDSQQEEPAINATVWPFVSVYNEEQELLHAKCEFNRAESIKKKIEQVRQIVEYWRQRGSRYMH